MNTIIRGKDFNTLVEVLNSLTITGSDFESIGTMIDNVRIASETNREIDLTSFDTAQLKYLYINLEENAEDSDLFKLVDAYTEERDPNAKRFAKFMKIAFETYFDDEDETDKASAPFPGDDIEEVEEEKSDVLLAPSPNKEDAPLDSSKSTGFNAPY